MKSLAIGVSELKLIRTTCIIVVQAHDRELFGKISANKIVSNISILPLFANRF
jgi:hypothetical protein